MSTGVLAVSWWCQTTKAPWDWTPKLYLGVWLMLAAFVIPYAVSMVRRHRTHCLLYTSPSPRDGLLSRMPSSA